MHTVGKPAHNSSYLTIAGCSVKLEFMFQNVVRLPGTISRQVGFNIPPSSIFKPPIPTLQIAKRYKNQLDEFISGRVKSIIKATSESMDFA